MGNSLPKDKQFIAYKMFASKEFHGNDPRAEFNFLIKYRNPKNIVDKIRRQFTNQTFKTAIDVNPILEGHIDGTVNDCLLVNFVVTRVPNKLDWSWTKMQVIEDPNLFPGYRKDRTVEEYAENYIDSLINQ
jgi:hypothetical protein